MLEEYHIHSLLICMDRLIAVASCFHNHTSYNMERIWAGLKAKYTADWHYEARCSHFQTLVAGNSTSQHVHFWEIIFLIALMIPSLVT